MGSKKNKHETKYKFFFKIPVGEILKDWLKKGELTEEEIPEVDTNFNLFYGDD